MDGIEWAASAMSAARARLEIATSNLANVSTDGFAKVLARGHLTQRGVRIERTTASAMGPLRKTDRPLDFAIVGGGTFRLRNADGTVVATRNGAFVRGDDGTLRDDAGRRLLGLRGPLRYPEGAHIDARGRVMLGGRHIDALPLDPDASLRAGFLETASVDGVREMIDVLTAQRGFETAQKVVSAIDGTRQKSANDVARIA